MEQREIKFRYRLEHIETKEVITKIFTIEEIEAHNWSVWYENYNVLSRDQYTGLLDKQNNRIYEGDIIDIRDSTIGTEDIVRGEVYWCDNYLEWSIQWLPKQSGADSIRLVRKSIRKNAKTPESSLGDRRWPQVEIIGNIYENLELLTNK